MPIALVLAWGLVLGTSVLAQADWPQFRGPAARGVAAAAMPTDWDVATGRNIGWRTPIPGLAHSSPVVHGPRLFVTSAVRNEGESELSSLFGSKGYGAGESVADEREHEFRVYCLDLATGKILWERTACEGVPKVKRHPKSSHANPTPACDARHVVASFGSEGLFCYDHDGELVWRKDLGVLNSGAPGYPDKDGFQWGFASSPVIHEDRVVVQCDHEGDSFVAVLDVATGEELWRAARAEDSTWCTPTVYEVGGALRVVVNGYKHIGAYDLATGAEVWKLSGGGDVPVPTPVVADGLVFLTSAHGRERPLRAVLIDASGELAGDALEQHVAWELPRDGVYMQTPIVVGELLYACSDGGILSCYEAKSGARLWRERIGTGETGFSASPVCAGGKLYLSGESGDVHIVETGREFRMVGVRSLGETCMATPALAGGTLLFRTRTGVLAVREGK
jgi:outer membrane protein assembly factor BamB